MGHEGRAQHQAHAAGEDEDAQGAALTALAPAKLNLTLEIRGRRSDCYHELVSLVAFADVGDRLSLEPRDWREVSLQPTGPFAAALDGENLVLRAARAFLDAYPDARGGRFVLDKRLPVAAGLGGGSSDAAAAVRLLARASASAGFPERADLDGLAPALSRLGADIPVCLIARAAWMTGIGERVAPLAAMPDAHAVLVNPGIPLTTRDVFAALKAPPLPDNDTQPVELPSGFPDLESLIGFLRERRNDLEPPARARAPVIAELLAALAGMPGCLLARLSGSGPTCFGLFGTSQAANAAARELSQRKPNWWIAPATLA